MSWSSPSSPPACSRRSSASSAEPMDASKYAALFLAESREHLSSCNQFLLEWERDPAATEPVAALFRAIHTVKGMAATMGYEAIADVAHRTENLLEATRNGRTGATPELLQLLFRAVDALSAGVERVGAGAEPDREGDAELLVALDYAAAANVGAPTAEFVAVRAAARARLVRVAIRPDATMRGGRAMIAVRRAETVGAVSELRPTPAAFERDDFGGAFAFRITSDAPDEVIAIAIRSAGDVVEVRFGEPGAGETGVESAAGGGRQIRVDLRRLDVLMKQVGELVVARNRLVDLAARTGETGLVPVAEQVSRLVTAMQAEIMQAR